MIQNTDKRRAGDVPATAEGTAATAAGTFGMEVKMFKINGENYEIEQAYMDALLDDEEEEKLMFGVVIEGKQADDKTLPSITSDTLLKTGKHEIKRWQDIAGRVVEWEKYSKNIWKPHAKFCNCYKNTFRENFIYNAKIEFKTV
ncbi:MAG: hypothetical protein LBK94_07700, partial [Prevotellaceae bacterium]|nr:hypothetical protein [Prevotellaceae bacterium]